jgi:hypothetical protein
MLLASADETLRDEFAEAVLLALGFDLRFTARPGISRLVENVVKLKYLAYAASQLPEVFHNQFECLTPDVFDQLWTVQWIRGGMIEFEEAYGDLKLEVVTKLAAGSLADDPELSVLLGESIEKLQLRVSKNLIRSPSPPSPAD